MYSQIGSASIEKEQETSSVDAEDLAGGEWW